MEATRIKDSLSLELQKEEYKVIEKESLLWKDFTPWFLTMLGVLLTAIPIVIAGVEVYRTIVSNLITNAKNKIEDASLLIAEASNDVAEMKKTAYQINAENKYQEIYFKEVTNRILSLMIEQCTFQGVNDSEMIFEMLQDYDKCVGLLHVSEKTRLNCISYIEQSESIYIRDKLISLLELCNDEKQKADIQRLIILKENNGNQT